MRSDQLRAGLVAAGAGAARAAGPGRPGACGHRLAGAATRNGRWARLALIVRAAAGPRAALGRLCLAGLGGLPARAAAHGQCSASRAALRRRHHGGRASRRARHPVPAGRQRQAQFGRHGPRHPGRGAALCWMPAAGRALPGRARLAPCLPGASAPPGRAAGGAAAGHRGLVPRRARRRLAGAGRSCAMAQPLPLRQAMATPAGAGPADAAPARPRRQRAGALGGALQGPAPERRRAGAAHRCLGWRAASSKNRNAQALHLARAHPEWFDLSDRHLVLLGAGSEAGPLALAGSLARQHRRHRPGARAHLEEDRAARARRQRPADRPGGRHGPPERRCRRGHGAGRLRHADADARDRRLADAAGPAAGPVLDRLPRRRKACARVAGDGCHRRRRLPPPMHAARAPGWPRRPTCSRCRRRWPRT